MNENKTEITKFRQLTINKIANTNTTGTLNIKCVGINVDATWKPLTLVISRTLNTACFTLKILSNSDDFQILIKVYFPNVESI